jgi:hypothetical protein
LLIPARSAVQNLTTKGKSWRLSEVKQKLYQQRHKYLQKEVNLQALNNLMIETISGWEGHVIKLLENTKQVAIERAQNAMEFEQFERWVGCDLYKKTKAFIHDFVSKDFESCKTMAIRMLRYETKQGVVYSEESKIDSVLDQSLFDVVKEKHIKELNESRHRARVLSKYLQSYPDEKQYLDQKDPTATARMKKLTEKPDFKDELGPDPFERELLVMAKMKAYYQYVATRCVESVIGLVQKDLLDGLNRVKSSLTKALHLDSQTRKSSIHSLTWLSCQC